VEVELQSGIAAVAPYIEEPVAKTNSHHPLA